MIFCRPAFGLWTISLTGASVGGAFFRELMPLVPKGNAGFNGRISPSILPGMCERAALLIGGSMKKNKSKIAVKKILLTLGEKEVALTLEQAKDLQQMLNEMFSGPERKTVEHVHHYDYWRKYWEPTYWLSTGGIGGAACENAKLQTLYQNALNNTALKAVGYEVQP